MTATTKFYCDKKDCNKERAGNSNLRIFSHSTSNGSGSDDWQVVADLCPHHLLEFTQFLIGLIEDNRLPPKLSDVFKLFNISSTIV